MKYNLYFSEIKPIEGLLNLCLAPCHLFFKGKSFEQAVLEKLRGLFNQNEIHLFNSARSGLFNLLKFCNFPIGSEVLVTGFTCSAVVEPIMFNKLKPIYVDIHKDSFSMDFEDFQCKLSNKTRAVVFQHSFGIEGKEFKKILKICKDRNILLIEDCALSFGSVVNEKYLGTIGDFGIFSFELSKSISSGWGGMVICNDKRSKDFHEFLRMELDYEDPLTSFRKSIQIGLSIILYHPILSNFSQRILQVLYKLNLFQSSETKFSSFESIPKEYIKKPLGFRWFLLLKQLKRINHILNEQKNNVSFYINTLNDLQIHQDHFSNYDEKNFSCRFPLLVTYKSDFIEIFSKAGFEVGSWFSKSISSPSKAQSFYGYHNNSCPNSENIQKEIVNLPCSTRISTSQRLQIKGLLKQYFARIQ